MVSLTKGTKMKKILMLILTISAMSISANAVCNVNSCTGKVETLFMTADGTLYVGMEGDEKALDCAAGAGNGGIANVYMSLQEGDVGKNAMYSLLLTAKTTGKSLTVRAQTGSSDCRVLYVAQ